MDKVNIIFKKHYQRYWPGDCAGFPRAVADGLISTGTAVEAKDWKPKPQGKRPENYLPGDAAAPGARAGAPAGGSK